MDALLESIEQAEKLTEWSVPAPMVRPPGIKRLLFFANRRMGLAFTGQPWRFVLSAAGEIMSAAILVRAAKKTADPARRAEPSERSHNIVSGVFTYAAMAYLFHKVVLLGNYGGT